MFHSVPQSIIIHTNNYIQRNGTEQEYPKLLSASRSKLKTKCESNVPSCMYLMNSSACPQVRRYVYLCVCLSVFLSDYTYVCMYVCMYVLLTRYMSFSCILNKTGCVLAFINLVPFRSAKYNYPYRLLYSTERNKNIQNYLLVSTVQVKVYCNYSCLNMDQKPMFSQVILHEIHFCTLLIRVVTIRLG